VNADPLKQNIIVTKQICFWLQHWLDDSRHERRPDRAGLSTRRSSSMSPRSTASPQDRRLTPTTIFYEDYIPLHECPQGTRLFAS